MDSSLKNLKKLWMSSLSFLEHHVVYSIIVFIVVLYILGVFSGINSFIGGLYNFMVVKLIVILLIIWVAPKDPTLAILLALSYAVSLQHMASSENFVSPVDGIDMSQAINNVMSEESVAVKEQFKQHHDPRNGRDGAHHTAHHNVHRDVHHDRHHNAHHNAHHDSHHNRHHDKQRGDKKHTNTKEHFFPLGNPNDDERIGTQTRQKTISNSNNTLVSGNSSCMDLYEPHFESVSNVCDPVATFQGELNAQGINSGSPDGFDSIAVGSPLA